MPTLQTNVFLCLVPVRLLQFPVIRCLGDWVRLVSVTSPRRMAGRSLAWKNVLCSFSAQLGKHVSLTTTWMTYETSMECNFDTVSDAVKDIIKILLPLCVNDVLYDPLSIDFSSCRYITTEHLGKFVILPENPRRWKLFWNLELRDLDKTGINLVLISTRRWLMLPVDCCFIYDFLKLFPYQPLLIKKMVACDPNIKT